MSNFDLGFQIARRRDFDGWNLDKSRFYYWFPRRDVLIIVTSVRLNTKYISQNMKRRHRIDKDNAIISYHIHFNPRQQTKELYEAYPL